MKTHKIRKRRFFTAHLFFRFIVLGRCANATPRRQKLRTRVTRISSNRKTQLARGAMSEPPPGATASLITVVPVPSKYVRP